MAMNGDYVEKCVQCGTELNFLHSDITVIILHSQILILYNWRPYLSINPRILLPIGLCGDAARTYIKYKHLD